MIFLHLDIKPPFGLETGGAITSHRADAGAEGDGPFVFRRCGNWTGRDIRDESNYITILQIQTPREKVVNT